MLEVQSLAARGRLSDGPVRLLAVTTMTDVTTVTTVTTVICVTTVMMVVEAVVVAEVEVEVEGVVGAERWWTTASTAMARARPKQTGMQKIQDPRRR